MRLAAQVRRPRPHARVMFSVGVAVGGVVVARLLGSVVQIMLARWMGVADFGLYTTVYTLLGPVVMIASLGLDTWLLRQSSATDALAANIAHVFTLRLIATVALMVPAIVLVRAIQPELTGLVVGLAGTGLLCELLLTTAHTALRAQLRNGAAALLQVLVGVLMIALLWELWDARAPLTVATGYRLLASAAGVAMLCWLLRGSLRLAWHPTQLWATVRQSSVYFGADLLANVALKADLTMVALFLGSSPAGIYNPALTIINTTFMVPHVAWQALLPVVARQREQRSTRTLLRLVFASSLAYGLFWLVALLSGAGWIVHLIYGAKYADAVPLVQIMCLIPFFKSINFYTATMMVAHDAQMLRAKLLAVGASINTLANLVCIPLFGLRGAAWVNLATEITLLLCYGYGYWRSVKRR